MKAYVIREFGPPETFETIEVPEPEAAPGHVVLRVRGSSVNPIDTKIRSGKAAIFAPPFPAILHGDVAGVIEAVGYGVTRFKKGDEVYGCIGGIQASPGGLADFAVADERFLAHKPRSLSLEDAAALPLVALTAWEALVDRTRVQPGEKVLIHAGAGGVGHWALQLAKAQGATVYTTVSSEEKSRIARELGADHVIHYKTTPVAEYVKAHTGGRGFDVVFDTVGGANLDASFVAVAHGGRVATIAAMSTHDLTQLYIKGATLHFELMLLPLLTGQGRERHGEILRKTADLIDQGRLKPLIDPERFEFARASDAHRKLEAGKALGKIALHHRG